ncbi:MAG: macro domain-containing protein [Planctomycetota bacterium]|nr:MAG: macro domain-containing protein [Planctomycetota bacterium]
MPLEPARIEHGRAVLASGHALVAVEGDLVREQADALVNAANEELAHGGGVAGALASAAGPELQAESDRWVDAHGPLATGRACATGAGRLAARCVIHAIGPIWRGGRNREPELLASAVTSALEVAREQGCASVALPVLSAGIYGYPPRDAVRVIAAALRAWCAAHPDELPREIRVVALDAGLAEELGQQLGQQLAG